MQDKLPVRHGDLSFHPIDKLPEGAKFIGKVDAHTAGLGETTGHKHVVKSDTKFDVYEIEDKQANGEIIKRWAYLLEAPAVIEHEEHRTIELPAGIYEQKQEIEEDPFTEETHQVID